MKDELQPLGKKLVRKNSCTNQTMSSSIKSQKEVKNLKVNPSGPGARSPPQSQTALLISSREKGRSRKSHWLGERELSKLVSKVGEYPWAVRTDV
ncbi:hypothetical protein Tco_1167460 [Tanacetum coccineum]